ncbi:HTH-like domain protein [Rickettsia hoogstraalii str. RCCE3]|nr:HTH-like domain protein [Rickettsia hoogstraalii str. RCCE3]
MISYASNLTMARQCKLLDLNRSSYYYRARNTLDDKEYRVLNRIDEIFTEHPYYGTRRMSHVLKSEGLNVSRKMIRKYYKILSIEAVYPKINLSRRNQAHKVYPYLLNNIEVFAPIKFTVQILLT